MRRPAAHTTLLLVALCVALTTLCLTCDFAAASGGGNRVYRAFACESETITAVCPQGHKIVFLGAEYRPADVGECSKVPPLQGSPENDAALCRHNIDALTRFKKACTEAALASSRGFDNTCSVEVADSTMSRLRCPSTMQVAEIHYACEHDETASNSILTSVCERTPMILECPLGNSLYIQSAKIVPAPKCPYRPRVALLDFDEDNEEELECKEQDVTKLLGEKCDGHATCAESVPSRTFGAVRHCVGQAVSLQVSWTCVDAAPVQVSLVAPGDVASMQCAENMFVAVDSAIVRSSIDNAQYLDVTPLVSCSPTAHSCYHLFSTDGNSALSALRSTVNGVQLMISYHCEPMFAADAAAAAAAANMQQISGADFDLIGDETDVAATTAALAASGTHVGGLW